MKISLFKFLIVVVGILLGLSSYSQQTKNYLNNWYFGDAVGISFNTGAAVNATSAISAYEVSTSYSDGAGNVLFYTGADQNIAYGKGRVVWDATHDTMPNSDINVDYNSSCGLTTVPVPGNCDQYYIFHQAAVAPFANSISYSIVDMTLPGNGTVGAPLGDILPGQKDVLIYGLDTLAEKVKVVQKGNTEDFWLIVRSLNRDVFYSFEVTALGGVNTVPVISTISATAWPTAIGSPIFSWLAVNKDRNLIAEANGFGPDFKLFSFDNLTGVLSLEEVLIPTGTFGSDILYGTEFSPSGDVLYVSWWEGANNTYISSFDITAGIGSIGATRQDFPITTGSSGEYGALVKAPDGKIYGTRNSTNQLTVINTPENYLAPNIVNAGFVPTPGAADIGMPNLTYYYHPDNFIDTLAGNDRSSCDPFQTELGAIGYDSIWADYSWSPAAMLVGDSTEATPLTVNLTSDQEYILHVIHACGDTIKSDTVMVAVSSLDASIITNSPICDGESLTLNGSPSGLGAGSYTWVRPNGNPIGGAGLNNVFITPFPNPIPGGWWYLTVDDGVCTDTDSTFVVTHPVYNIRDTINVCVGGSYTYADGTVSTNILVDEFHLSTDTSVFGCDSNLREYLVVDTLASPIIYTPDSWYCVGDNLTDLNSDNATLWYSDAALTVPVATDSFMTPQVIVGTTTYYAIDTVGGCTSLPDSVNVTFENCSYPCATNILTNGDFETYIGCPTNVGQIDSASGWMNIQGNSNDYHNQCGHNGRPPYLPGFNGVTQNMFINPQGNGYAGFIPGGNITGFSEGFGRVANLKKCVEYTLQLRMAYHTTVDSSDIDICVYGGNSPTAAYCMAGYTSLGCISADSINQQWRVFTVTFTPTQDYTYIAIAGACPSQTTYLPVPYVYVDDMFLCRDTCLNQATNILPINLTSDTCSAGTGSGSVDFTTNCYTGFDFVWLDGASNPVSTDSLATGLMSGNYTVEVTDSNNCMISTNVVIPLVNNCGALIPPNDTSICLGDSVLLVASGSNSGYNWVDSLTLAPLGTDSFYMASPLVTTTYGVYNATDTVYTKVTVELPVDAGLDGVATLCPGAATVNLYDSLGGVPDITGVWSPVLLGGNLGSYDPQVNPSGTYEYIVSSSGICPDDTSEIVVTILPGVDAGISDSITLCVTDPIDSLFNLLGGTPDVSGTWSPTLANGNLGVFDPASDPAGTYLYIVPGVGNCLSDTSSIKVSFTAAVDAGVNNTIDLCPGAPIINLYDSLGGTPDIGGTWVGSLAGGSLGTFDPATDTAGVYMYIVTSATCGTDTAYLTVNVYGTPYAGLDNTITLCSTGSAVNLYDSLGGTPNTSGVWSPLLPGGYLGVFNPVTNPANVYTYVVSSTPLCPADSAEVNVIITQPPVAGINSVVTVCSSGATVNLFDSLGGIPDVTGTWMPSLLGGHLGTFSSGVNPAGVYTYTVLGGACPDAVATVTVNFHPVVDAGTSGSITLCSTGGTVDLFNSLTGSPDVTGTWSPVLLGGSLGTFTPGTDLATTYQYNVPGLGGCSGDSSTVSVNNPPNVGMDSSLTMCVGDPSIDLFSFTGGADLGGAWSPVLASGTGIFNPQLDGAGSYSYVIDNAPCPADSSTVLVVVQASPTLAIVKEDDNCQQAIGSIAVSPLTGVTPFTYNWNPPSNDSVLSGLVEGVYTVIVSDSLGCTNSYAIDILNNELDCDYHVYLPNVFSPNGDGENDILYVLGKGVETINLTIYNRWGNKVFESNDMTQGWDGTYNGNEQGNAVFVYYISATFVNGLRVEDKGNVSIVK